MKCAVQLLNKAAQHLQKHKWIRLALAENKRGDIVDPRSKQAESFCALGALLAVELEFPVPERRKARRLLRKAINFSSIAEWNDDVIRNKQGVIAAFKKAAKKGAEQK